MPRADATIEFIPEGWEEAAERFADSPEIVYGTINTMLRRMGQHLVPIVKQETPVGATSRLRNYTVFQVLGTRLDQRMEIRQSAFRGDYPYGVGVRLGTRPHFPPYRELIPWVIRKLGVDARQAPRVAFLVARKISKVGTKPNPYHERAFNASLSELQEMAREAVDHIVEWATKSGTGFQEW